MDRGWAWKNWYLTLCRNLSAEMSRQILIEKKSEVQPTVISYILAGACFYIFRPWKEAWKAITDKTYKLCWQEFTFHGDAW